MSDLLSERARTPRPGGRPPQRVELVELVAATAAGDHAAFAELHAQCHRYVRSVVCRTLRQSAHVDDVVQEVFVDVWEHSGDYEPKRARVLWWIHMLAHRRAVDRVRRERSTALRDNLHATRSAVPCEDIGDEVGLRLDAERLHAALAQLTPAQREALVMTYLRGRSHSQAATELSLPLGTLKSRVRDGLAVLRLSFAGCADPSPARTPGAGDHPAPRPTPVPG